MSATAFPIQSRWVYQSDQPIDVSVRQQIFEHLLDSFDRSMRSVEEDVVEHSKKVAEDAAQNLQNSLPSGVTHVRGSASERQASIVDDLTQQGVTTEMFRTRSGVMRQELESILTPEKMLWKPADGYFDAPVSSDVQFSIDMLLEAVERTHGSGLGAFATRWAFLQESSAAIPSDNPLDLRGFVHAVHQTQSKAKVPNALCSMMFLSLEQELVQSLSFLLFDVNSRLADSGVLPDLDGLGTMDNGGHANAMSLEYGKKQSGVNDESLFNSLCELLSVWDPSMHREAPVEPGAAPSPHFVDKQKRPLSSQEVFSAIGTLQRWVPKALEDALGHPDGRLAEHIKDTLVKQAESFGVPKSEVKISEDDSRAVDLVDQVFTQNLYDRKMERASRVIVAQMLFPSVKAAILNRQWFAQQSHPARRLINSVADACAPENGVASSPEVMNKASQTVDRLIAGFNEDVSVFEVLAKEFQNYLDGQKNTPKAGVTDLDLLKEKITDELGQRWYGYKGPDSLKSFALEIAVPYFADLEINKHRGTMTWAASMNIMDNLMSLKSDRNNPVKIDGQLRGQLMRMLTFNGWTGVRAHHRLAEQEDAIHLYYVPDAIRTAPAIPEFDARALLDEEIRLRKIATTPTKTAVPQEHSLATVQPAVQETAVQEPAVQEPAAEKLAMEEPNEKLAKKTPSQSHTNQNAKNREAEQAQMARENELALSEMVRAEKEAETSRKLERDRVLAEQARLEAEERVAQEKQLAEKSRQEAQKQEAEKQEAQKQKDAQEEAEKIRIAAEAQAAEQAQSAKLPAKPILRKRAAAPLVAAPETFRAQHQLTPPDRLAHGDRAQMTLHEAVKSKILALQVGSLSTWIGADSELVVVKLSWISPQMKFLFVNEKGLRVVVGTPDELVEHARKGRFFPDTVPSP